MDKYIGFIKVYEGNVEKILSKTCNNEELLKIWFDLYPNSKHIILENNEELDSMYKMLFSDEKEIVEDKNKSYKKTKSNK